jgi:hypothetical protein
MIPQANRDEGVRFGKLYESRPFGSTQTGKNGNIAQADGIHQRLCNCYDIAGRGG